MPSTKKRKRPPAVDFKSRISKNQTRGYGQTKKPVSDTSLIQGIQSNENYSLDETSAEQKIPKKRGRKRKIQDEDVAEPPSKISIPVARGEQEASAHSNAEHPLQPLPSVNIRGECGVPLTNITTRGEDLAYLSPTEPLDPLSSVNIRGCDVPLMNITTHRRVGLAVKILLSRIDVDDGLTLPLTGIEDYEFDHFAPLGLEIGEVYSAEHLDESTLDPVTGELVNEQVWEGDLSDEVDFAPDNDGSDLRPQLRRRSISTDSCSEVETAAVSPSSDKQPRSPATSAILLPGLMAQGRVRISSSGRVIKENRKNRDVPVLRRTSVNILPSSRALNNSASKYRTLALKQPIVVNTCSGISEGVASTPSSKFVVSTPSSKVAASTPSSKVVASTPSRKLVASMPSSKVVASTPNSKVAASKPSSTVVASMPSSKGVTSSQSIIVKAFPTTAALKESGTFKLSDDVVLIRAGRAALVSSNGAMRVISGSGDSSTDQNKKELELRNTKVLLPNEKFDQVKDFSTIPNIMDSPQETKDQHVKIAGVKTKYKVVFENLLSPSHELPLDKWLQELLWKFVKAELFARQMNTLLNEDQKVTKPKIIPKKINELTILKKVEEQTADKIPNVASASITESSVCLSLKNGRSLSGIPTQDPRWFSIPLLGKSLFYNLTTNKIYDDPPEVYMVPPVSGTSDVKSPASRGQVAGRKSPLVISRDLPPPPSALPGSVAPPMLVASGKSSDGVPLSKSVAATKIITSAAKGSLTNLAAGAVTKGMVKGTLLKDLKTGKLIFVKGLETTKMKLNLKRPTCPLTLNKSAADPPVTVHCTLPADKSAADLTATAHCTLPADKSAADPPATALGSVPADKSKQGDKLDKGKRLDYTVTLEGPFNDDKVIDLTCDTADLPGNSENSQGPAEVKELKQGKLRKGFVMCGINECCEKMHVDIFADHCNINHIKDPLGSHCLFDDQMVFHYLDYFTCSYVCAAKDCRKLFLSQHPIKKAQIVHHWNNDHPNKKDHSYSSPSKFMDMVRVIKYDEKSKAKAISQMNSTIKCDILKTALDKTFSPPKVKALRLLLSKEKKGPQVVGEIEPAPVMSNAVITLQAPSYPPNVPMPIQVMHATRVLNRKIMKNMLDFFCVFLDTNTKTEVAQRINSIILPNLQYFQRRVGVRDSGLPTRDCNGAVINEEYCTRKYHMDLLEAVMKEFGDLRQYRTLEPQQYTWINKEKLLEKVFVYTPLAHPNLHFTVKTYKEPVELMPSMVSDKKFCNVIVRNTEQPECVYSIPGMEATQQHQFTRMELSALSECLSKLPCRDLRPVFDVRGLLRSQTYCCPNTYVEMMTQWWENFLHRIPSIDETMADGQTDFFSKLVSLDRRISINGISAVPKKKEFHRKYKHFLLYINLTFFSTETASLNLALVRIQWINAITNEPIESERVDLPAMNTVDTMIDYMRMSHADSFNTKIRSCYKTSEVSLLEKVKLLVNVKCIPRNQAIFVNVPKNLATADLRAYLGHLNRTHNRPAQLYIGSSKYSGTASGFSRRIPDLPYHLIIMITSFQLTKNYSDSQDESSFPDSFTQIEIRWTTRQKHWPAGMVDDDLVDAFPYVRHNRKNMYLRRYLRKDPELLEMIGRIGCRIACFRWRILNKYSNPSMRPDTHHLKVLVRYHEGKVMLGDYWNQTQKKAKKAQAARKEEEKAKDELAAAVTEIAVDQPTDQPKAEEKKKTKEDEDSDEEEDDADILLMRTANLLKDGLVYYDTSIKSAQAVTYNKREEKGILMVRSSRSLLHALVGATTTVNAGWDPRPLEIEVYEPRLTNAYMILTGFVLPNVIHKTRGTPKLCLGPVALSTFKSEHDALLLGEHLKYNNDNVTRVNSIASCSDDLFHAMRTGLKAFNCIYTYDENSALNSATNRAKCLKNGIKEAEVSLSAELGALRVSWEVYMNKIIALKQDADLAEVFLSLDETEEYVLADPEGVRLFGLNPLEKSQLEENELRKYEMEFFEWLGLGTYPDIPWKEYVNKKVSFDPNFVAKTLCEEEFTKWNQDESFDNQFFGNMILQQGTLAKTSKNYKKKKLKVKEEKSPTKGRGARVMELDDFHVEDNQSLFSAFNRVVVDGTFMI